MLVCCYVYWFAIKTLNFMTQYTVCWQRGLKQWNVKVLKESCFCWISTKIMKNDKTHLKNIDILGLDPAKDDPSTNHSIQKYEQRSTLVALRPGLWWDKVNNFFVIMKFWPSLFPFQWLYWPCAHIPEAENFWGVSWVRKCRGCASTTTTTKCI